MVLASSLSRRTSTSSKARDSQASVRSVLSVVQNRTFGSEFNDLLDVAFEWRAVDAVRRKQFLSLAGVVKLFHEEVGNCMVRQSRDLRRWRQHEKKVDPGARRRDAGSAAVNRACDRIE